MKWILSSPLHGLLSKNMMLISFKGRKSGKEYTLPINYVQDDSVLLATSYRYRTWWKNLRRGLRITLRIRGQNLNGVGEALVNEEDVARHLEDYLKKVPKQIKYFNVTLDPDGNPNLGDIAKAAKDRVGIRIQLKTS